MECATSTGGSVLDTLEVDVSCQTVALVKKKRKKERKACLGRDRFTIGGGIITVNMFYVIIRHTAKQEGKRHGKIIHKLQ